MFLQLPVAMMNGNIDFTLNHMHYCTLDKLYHRLTEYHVADYTDYGKIYHRCSPATDFYVISKEVTVVNCAIKQTNHRHITKFYAMR